MTDHTALDTTTVSPAAPATVPALRPGGTGLRVGPVKLCPTCRTELDEGPIVFRCRPCGKAVRAADIDTEYHQPTSQPTGVPAGQGWRAAA